MRLVKKAGKLFRLVLYTASGPAYADSIMEYVDPSNLIYERLYRKDLVKKNNKLEKDLSKFSSDMSRVLILDSKPDGVDPVENHLIIKPFVGHDPSDTELKKLIDFFKDRISEQQHNVDLREIINEFREVPQ